MQDKNISQSRIYFPDHIYSQTISNADNAKMIYRNKKSRVPQRPIDGLGRANDKVCSADYSKRPYTFFNGFGPARYILADEKMTTLVSMVKPQKSCRPR